MVGEREEVFHSGGRLRAYALSAYALSAELNTIASARTLAESITCTSRSARVVWRPSQHAATAEQVRRPSVVHAAAVDTSDVASSGSSPPDLSDSITP